MGVFHPLRSGWRVLITEMLLHELLTSRLDLTRPVTPLRGIFPDEDTRSQKISSISNLTLAPTRAIFPGCIADSSICLNTLLMSFSLKETCQGEVDLLQAEHRGFFRSVGHRTPWEDIVRAIHEFPLSWPPSCPAVLQSANSIPLTIRLYHMGL